MDAPDRTRGGQGDAVRDDLRMGLAVWRSAHPHASFAEIEAEVETQLGPLRAQLVADAALTGVGTSSGEQSSPTGRRPCPVCGGALVARGKQERQVRLRGDQRVSLDRTYVTCTACHRGLFPPG